MVTGKGVIIMAKRTEMKLVETWRESGKYDEAMALLQKTLETKDDLVYCVDLTVTTVIPGDGAAAETSTEKVHFEQRYKYVEEED